MSQIFPKILRGYQRFRDTRLGAWFSLWPVLVLVAVTPLFSGFLFNLVLVSVQDLYIPLLFDCIVATGIALICFPFFLKRRFTTYLVAVFLTYMVGNGFIERIKGAVAIIRPLLPVTLPQALLAVVYFGAVLYVAYLIARFIEQQVIKRQWRTQDITNGLSAIIFLIFLTKFIPSVVDLAEAWPQYFYQPAALANIQLAAPATKPDIYYIILEDYANQSVLKNDLHFDNSAFLTHLSESGFHTIPTALSSYPYTVDSVASTFSANYLSDQVNQFAGAINQTLIPYFSTVRNSPVVQQLKSLGYTYHLLGDWYETSNYSPLADHTYTGDNQLVFLNHTYGLNEFASDQVEHNILSLFLNHGLSVGGKRWLGYNMQGEIAMDQSQLDQLKSLASKPAGGRFIFAQILAPHNTFYFNADGSLNTTSAPDNQDQLAVTKYTNEVQYINNQIQPILDQIIKNSGGTATIILQSDEGLPLDFINTVTNTSQPLDQANGDMTKWPRKSLQMKYGILASYYVPGATPTELEQAADPVNIFRLTLNKAFNAGLSYLPKCHYGFPEGENAAFIYQNIATELTGTTNAGCPANGNFITPGSPTLIKVKGMAGDLDTD